MEENISKAAGATFGDVFFHQRSAEIVGAGLQAGKGSLDSQLYPGDLNMANCAVQKDTRKRMNAQVLVARCPRPCSAMVVEAGVLGDVTQRNRTDKSGATVQHPA